MDIFAQMLLWKQPQLCHNFSIFFIFSCCFVSSFTYCKVLQKFSSMYSKCYQLAQHFVVPGF